jgi:SAM-dependent methyltransferase
MDLASLTWESSPCDYCGHQQGVFLFSGPDRATTLPGMFGVVRCPQCGLLRQEPRLTWESLAHYYTEEYPSHGALAHHQKTWWRRLDKRYGPWKRLRAIERWQPGGSLLEVGSGSGTFLEEALRSGKWRVTGIEPSAAAAQYAQENLGVPILPQRFAEVELAQESMDVVAMWNVLEHLDHPIAELRHASSLLRPGGLLVLAVPNLESADASLFKEYWLGWELPRHLYWFPRRKLELILEELGFRVLEWRCLSTSYFVLGQSLEYWSQSWRDRHPRLQRLLLRTYHNPIMRALLVIPLGVLDRLRLSTIITVFAQKLPTAETGGQA